MKSLHHFVATNYYIQLTCLIVFSIAIATQFLINPSNLLYVLFLAWMLFGGWQVLTALFHTFAQKTKYYHTYLIGLLVFCITCGALMFTDAWFIILVLLLIIPIPFAILNFIITVRLFRATGTKTIPAKMSM